jgi:hypothetical protein
VTHRHADARPRIAILSIRYSIEVSPLLKALAADASRRGSDVTILTDEFGRESGGLVVPAVSAHCLRPRWMSFMLGSDAVKRYRPGRLALRGLRKLDRFVMRRRLKSRLRGVSLCFVAEYPSLQLAMEAGLRLEATVYLSLEGSDYLTDERDAAVARRALPLCRAVCVASPQRAEGLKRELALPDMDFVYLPVSTLGAAVARASTRSRGGDDLRLVYSGYFAPWAQLKELVEAFTAAARGTTWTLTIHGHSWGTEGYRDEVLALAAAHAGISIDEAYYEDDSYTDFLSKFDIGVALYSSGSDQSNWGNLSLSSGKIAAYCQAGLAIVTNLEDPVARSEPFLPVARLDGASLADAARTYLGQPERYRESSVKLFASTYDAAPHLRRLWAALRLPELSDDMRG